MESADAAVGTPVGEADIYDGEGDSTDYGAMLSPTAVLCAADETHMLRENARLTEQVSALEAQVSKLQAERSERERRLATLKREQRLKEADNVALTRERTTLVKKVKKLVLLLSQAAQHVASLAELKVVELPLAIRRISRVLSNVAVEHRMEA